MPDVSDYQLFKSTEPPPCGVNGFWVAVAVILVAAIAACSMSYGIAVPRPRR